VQGRPLHRPAQGVLQHGGLERHILLHAAGGRADRRPEVPRPRNRPGSRRLPARRRAETGDSRRRPHPLALRQQTSTSDQCARYVGRADGRTAKGQGHAQILAGRSARTRLTWRMRAAFWMRAGLRVGRGAAPDDAGRLGRPPAWASRRGTPSLACWPFVPRRPDVEAQSLTASTSTTCSLMSMGVDSA